MPEPENKKFVQVATVLSNDGVVIDEVYGYLRGTLKVLFNSESFPDFELLHNDIEYEGGPRDHWALSFQAKLLEEDTSIKRRDFKSSFIISMKRDGDVTIYRGDTFKDIVLGSIPFGDEDIAHNQTSFSVNTDSPTKAAANIIKKLCAHSGVFSECLENYAHSNPDIIKPPQFPAYNPNGNS